MASVDLEPTLDMREKLAHIDLMLAQHDRVRQEIRIAPWVAVISGIAAGGALVGAGAALATWIIRFHG